MSLRNCVLIVAIVALLAGCHGFGNRNGTLRMTDNKDHPSRSQSKPDPKAAAENEVELAGEYIRDKEYQIALERLQKAVKLDSSSATAYSMLGLLYERINRPQLADQNYARSAKMAPDKGDIQNNYAVWLCQSGHPAESDVYFRKALNDPFYKTPATAMVNAAACATAAGKPALAEGYYRQVLATDSTNAAALYQVASLLFQRGEYMNARAFMERASATGEVAPEILDLGARIEDKLGDRTAADGYRQRLSQDFPQYTPGKS